MYFIPACGWETCMTSRLIYIIFHNNLHCVIYYVNVINMCTQITNGILSIGETAYYVIYNRRLCIAKKGIII